MLNIVAYFIGLQIVEITKTSGYGIRAIRLRKNTFVDVRYFNVSSWGRTFLSIPLIRTLIAWISYTLVIQLFLNPLSSYLILFAILFLNFNMIPTLIFNTLKIHKATL